MPGEKVSDVGLVPPSSITEDLIFYCILPDPGNPGSFISKRMTLAQLKSWLDSH